MTNKYRRRLKKKFRVDYLSNNPKCGEVAEVKENGQWGIYIYRYSAHGHLKWIRLNDAEIHPDMWRKPKNRKPGSKPVVYEHGSFYADSAISMREFCDEQSKQGWELVSVTQNGVNEGYTAFFRRPCKDEVSGDENPR